MPTFTAIALERLLEPKNSDRNTSSLPLKKQINTNNNTQSTTVTKTKKKPPKHIYISPALYTTPEPAPIPYTSTDSGSPSPYVVNRKRRDLRVPEAVNRLDGFEIRVLPKEDKDLGNGDEGSSLANRIDESCPVTKPFLEEEGLSDTSSLDVEIVGVEGEGSVEEDLVDRNESSSGGFVVPRDSMSVTSCSEVDDLRNDSVNLSQVVSIQTEFFDADEEFFSDASVSNASPSPNTSIVELHAARVKLFEEIERRKIAEEAVARIQNQWEGINKHLSQVGLSFPAARDAGYDTQVEQFCQEVIVARYVSEAIGRGLVRAETEAAAEALLESKNLEVSRLRDKLQYYEAVNHEMFQRNQEVVELARTQRHKRKTKQRWIWSCIGLSITIGASVLAYSYLPEMSTDSSMNSTDVPDKPPDTTESTFIGG